MDFSIKNLWCFEIGGVQIWITQTIVNTWIIMLLLIIFAVFVRIKLKNFKDIPGKFQNVIEIIVETFDGFVRNTVGEELAFIGNWYFTVFSFILLSNISGLFGLRPPTADWVTTVTFALATFALIQIMGIRSRGAGYIKKFFQPIPIFFPMNVIGELARPVSLSFRLFGNMLAGTILISLLYSLAPMLLRFFLPVVLHVFFDLFCGILQTYIFCVLSMTFIAAASAAE